MSDNNPLGDRRKRFPISLRVDFRKSGMQRSKADLVNISSTGFMADSAIRIAQGDRVWATFPGMEPKAAIVIWSREFEIGCEFIDPISDYAFDALLRKLQETGE